MIVLTDSEDEAALRSAFGRVFAKYQAHESDPEGTAANRIALWSQLTAMGALSMASSGTTSDGGGATLAQLCIVAEESGANLDSAGLIEHLAVMRVLGASASDAARDVVFEGISTIALRPSSSGRWTRVLTSAAPSMVAGVHRDALGLQRLSPASDIGQARGPLRLCDFVVDEDHFVYLGPAVQHQTALETWRVLTAAYLVGAGDRVLARTVAYVADRHQFGRPIGAYQAVQHGLADLPGMLTGARLLVGKAAWSLDHPDQASANDLARNDINDAGVLASMALLFAVDAANLVVDRAIHYHGAVGAAAETGLHNFYRMVRSLPLLLGPISTQRRRLADLLLGPTWTSH
jgi:hypothetical protein